MPDHHAWTKQERDERSTRQEMMKSETQHGIGNKVLRDLKIAVVSRGPKGGGAMNG
jgi:hypothetical protein